MVSCARRVNKHAWQTQQEEEEEDQAEVLEHLEVEAYAWTELLKLTLPPLSGAAMAASFSAEERMWLDRAGQAEPSGLPMVDLVLHLGVRQILL